MRSQLILPILLLLFSSILAAPLKLQFMQPLQSFTTISNEFTKQLADTINGEIPIEVNPKSKLDDTALGNERQDNSAASDEETPIEIISELRETNEDQTQSTTLKIPVEKSTEPEDRFSDIYETVTEQPPKEFPYIQTLFWPKQPSEKMERHLKQDQVQHQMFTPLHTFMNNNIKKPKPVIQSERPLQMQQPISMSSYNQEMMQQQILALHRLQALQNLNAINMPWYPPQPLLVFLPMKMEENEKDIKINNDKFKPEINIEHKTDYPYENDDPDSVIINAANSGNEKEETLNAPQRTLFLLPNTNARLSLGDIISGIPWLPIEINVPDTIAWAYNGISNGISGIISIIGQWPFSRPSSKTNIQNLMLKQEPMTPMIMLVPMNAQMVQLPIMVR